MTLLEMKVQRDSMEKTYRKALNEQFMRVCATMAQSGESLTARQIEEKFSFPKHVWAHMANWCVSGLNNLFHADFDIRVRETSRDCIFVAKDDPTREVIKKFYILSYQVSGRGPRQNKKRNKPLAQQYDHCPEDDGDQCPFDDLPCSLCALNR